MGHSAAWVKAFLARILTRPAGGQGPGKVRAAHEPLMGRQWYRPLKGRAASRPTGAATTERGSPFLSLDGDVGGSPCGLEHPTNATKGIFPMKAIRVLSVLTMVLLSAGFLRSAHAQTKAIDVAGVTLQLGMSLEEVQKRLEPTRYQLQRLTGTYGSYAISASDGPPYESPGNLTFKDGKLWWIGKNWGSYFGPDAAAIFNALYGIVAKDGKSAIDATIEPKVSRQPGVVRHEIRINLADGRSISISYTETQKTAANVSILENVAWH